MVALALTPFFHPYLNLPQLFSCSFSIRKIFHTPRRTTSIIPKVRNRTLSPTTPFYSSPHFVLFLLRTTEGARSTVKGCQTRSPYDSNTAQIADASIFPRLLCAEGSTFRAGSSTAVPSLLADPSTKHSTCRRIETDNSTACSKKSSLQSRKGSI